MHRHPGQRLAISAGNTKRPDQKRLPELSSFKPSTEKVSHLNLIVLIHSGLKSLKQLRS